MADPKVTIQEENAQDAPEEIVVVTGDEAARPPAPAEQGDEHEDDEEEGYEDLRVVEQNDEDTPDRRKKERAERKARQRAARERKDMELETLRRQNEQLNQRLAAVEQATQGQQVQSVEQRLSWAKQHLNIAEQNLQDAINRGDGAATTKAMQYRDNARDAIRQLEVTKTQTRQEPQAPTQQTPQQQADPRLINHAANWFAANPWFDYNANTPEVQRAKTIERDLQSEGFDARNREFWTELSKRLKEQNVSAAPSQSTRRGPPVSGGAESVPAGKRVTYRISDDRMAAMKEAGIWDDPVRRDRQIKAYMDYDKQNPTR